MSETPGTSSRLVQLIATFICNDEAVLSEITDLLPKKKRKIDSTDILETSLAASCVIEQEIDDDNNSVLNTGAIEPLTNTCTGISDTSTDQHCQDSSLYNTVGLFHQYTH